MSDSALIQEITELRARLSEAEAENAGLRKHLESAVIGLGKSRVDRIEQLEAALREAYERNMGNLGGSCARAEAQDAALAESERKREEAERALSVARQEIWKETHEARTNLSEVGAELSREIDDLLYWLGYQPPQHRRSK